MISTNVCICVQFDFYIYMSKYGENMERPVLVMYYKVAVPFIFHVLKILFI